MSVLFHIMLWIATALTALFTVGCTGSETTRKLDRAKNLMEEHPDSARMLLDGIDSLRLSRSQAALYAVLDAQSRHKLDMPVPSSDSLLNLAVDRYTSRGPDSLLMKALFYRAVRNGERGEIGRATQDAVTAWDIAETESDQYWKAKTAEFVADLADLIQNYKEELKWRKLAADNYALAGRRYNHFSSLCDIESTYLNMHDSINARCLDDSLKKLVSAEPGENAMQLYYAYTSVFMKNEYGMIEEADSLYELLTAHGNGMEEDASLKLVKANVLLHRKKYDACMAMLDSLKLVIYTPVEKTILFSAYYRLAQATHSPELMAMSTDSLLNLQLALISQALNQAVTSTQRDYLERKSTYQTAARKRAVAGAWWILGISLGAGILAWVLYSIRITVKNRQLSERVTQILEMTDMLRQEEDRRLQLQAELESSKKMCEELNGLIASVPRHGDKEEDLDSDLKSELKERTSRINRINRRLSDLTNRVASLYAGQWTTLNMLCKEFLDKDNTKSSVIVANINRELEKLKSVDFVRSLERDLNNYSDKIVKKLRQQCPSLTEGEIRICILLFAGLYSTSIALLTDTKLRTYYSRKKGIANKILAIGSPDKDLFLSYFKH